MEEGREGGSKGSEKGREGGREGERGEEGTNCVQFTVTWASWWKPDVDKAIPTQPMGKIMIHTYTYIKLKHLPQGL